MMLHQLHFCFLAIMLLLCLKSGRAIINEEKWIDVPAEWDKTIYENDNTEAATMKVTCVSGIRNRQSNTDTVVATHTVGIIGKGDVFSIVSLEFSHTYNRESSSSVMSKNEIYYTQTIENTVTVPPRSTLTRWELAADIAGTIIGYRYYIDAINNTRETPHINTSRAKVLLVRRRINYGHTLIRIKHLRRGEYMTVIRKGNWPAVTLGDSSGYLFILCEDELGIRLKTLNTTHNGRVWAYAKGSGNEIYFDWHREIGYSRKEPNVSIQHWLISKEEPQYNGDVVTFRNTCYVDCAMCYNDGNTTNVYCISGREDKWVLETADETDSSINQCH